MIFTESGLPHGATWSVSIGAKMVSTSTNRISFVLGRGVYSFSVSANGYGANPSSGNFTLTGAGTTIAITF